MFSSRSISARSGNRGACSQPCRQTWDLTDGRGRRYITGKHLLSVRDLNLSARSGQPRRLQSAVPPDVGSDRRSRTALHHRKTPLSVRDLNLSARIADLLDAGVTSFKIEGRLKDTGYIKNVVAYYRRAVDEALPWPHPAAGIGGREPARLHARPVQSSGAANRHGFSTVGGPVWRRSIRRSRSASRWGMSGRCCAMGSGSTGFRTGRPRAKRAIRFGLRIRSLRATASVS